MQRLREAYIAKNPQVRQVTGPTASDADLERWDALSDDDMSVDEEDVLHSPEDVLHSPEDVLHSPEDVLHSPPRPGTIVDPKPPSSSSP